MLLCEMISCGILTSCFYGVVSSPLGDILNTPVRVISNVYYHCLAAILIPIAETPSPGLGAQILRAVGPSLLPWDSKDSSSFTFCDAMHAVLVSELQLFCGEDERGDRESHLQHIVATYMFFAPLLMSVGSSFGLVSLFSCFALTLYAERYNLDEDMVKLFRALPPSEFSSCLQFVTEALSPSPNDIASHDFACLVRLISLALLNAPESQFCLSVRLERNSSYKKKQTR